MEQRIYHYPVWLRFWHMLNALLCLSLILTGIILQYSNPKNVVIRFDIAITIHNFCGIVLAINYLLFFIGNIVTGNIKFYVIKIKGFFQLLKLQMQYYTKGIFKGAKAPFPVTQDRKFNPLQQISYIVIMYIALPVIIITGLALLFPETIIHKVFGISGLLLTDLLHITTGFFISVFLLIHVYFCTTGIKFGSLFKSMINGWAEIH